MSPLWTSHNAVYCEHSTHPDAKWIGNAGPWLCACTYVLVGDAVWGQLSATQEHYVGAYASFAQQVLADLKLVLWPPRPGTVERLLWAQKVHAAHYTSFRGAPAQELNPWTQAEHDALLHHGVLPENPWGRRVPLS